MSKLIEQSLKFESIGHFASRPDVEFPRHRWYLYKESFSPILVEKAIKDANVSGNQLIIDPFNGSGTVTLTASQLGYNSMGFEVNPFAAFLSKAKLVNANLNEFNKLKDKVFISADKGKLSPLLKYSTFSEKGNNSKWLFNSKVLNSFEGGLLEVEKNKNKISNLFKLSLIGAALDNSNAVKDGKCLKYRTNWEAFKFDKYSFLDALSNRIYQIEEDIFSEKKTIYGKSKIFVGDSRETIDNKLTDKFKLCITSPPYLNSFDYTDVYRPELFLGRFVDSSLNLQKLRAKTLRSHVEMKLKTPIRDDFGSIYSGVMQKIEKKKELLWDNQIPQMIQGYFEDIQLILQKLRAKALDEAQLWIVVSNSAYVDTEIPVDLIIGEIGSKSGWFLKEINVLRHINKRKTKYSSNISHLRESVIIFEARVRK